MSIKPNPFNIFDYAPMPAWVNTLKKLMRLYQPADESSNDDWISNSDIIVQIELLCKENPRKMDVVIIISEMGFRFEVKPYKGILWKVKKNPG